MQYKYTRAVRLNKFLAAQTDSSRRSIDLAIQEGLVKVNAKKASLGQILEIGDKVQYKTEVYIYKAKKEKRIVIALNKPPGLICSSSDVQGETVISSMLPAIKDAIGAKTLKLFSIGRLDKDSRGLLLLTNDGDLANELTHPSFLHEKEYLVTLKKPVTEIFLKKFASGVFIEVDDSRVKTKPCVVDLVAPKVIRVVLQQGYKRQIRLMAKALDNEVVDLFRIRIADIAIKHKFLDKSTKPRFLLKLGQGEFLEIKY